MFGPLVKFQVLLTDYAYGGLQGTDKGTRVSHILFGFYLTYQPLVRAHMKLIMRWVFRIFEPSINPI